MSKLIVIFSFLIVISFPFCHKENVNYMSEGTILGPDIRMCACCGGWFIKIDSTTYEFDSLPANSGIDLGKENFPLKVKLDWKLAERAACPDLRIDIQRITKE